MKENERLTPKQTSAIKALLSEPTTRKAAAAAGVSEATLYRWFNDAIFSAALREARGQMLEALLTNLQNAGEDAIKTLREVMTGAIAHPSARVRAALGVITMTLKAKDVLENEERMKTIETQLKQILGDGGGRR